MQQDRKFIIYAVESYKAIQESWETIYKNLRSEFPEHNNMGLEFPEAAEGNTKQFSIMGHSCRVSLTPHIEDKYVYGKLQFVRIISQQETVPLLELYFEDNGNIGQGTSQLHWNFIPIRGDGSRFAAELVGAFFESFPK